VTPNKGTHLAIEAARIAGVPLTLFGAIEDPDYWAAEVESRLGGAIRYGGHLDGAGLAAELGRASVYLFTPCWDEPFGLVAIEAMACGLPIAAFDQGAAREVVGEAGCIAPAGDSVALAEAIRAAIEIPRSVARQRVETHFARDLWLDRCEALYAQVRAATPSAIAA
jgi:glycosyltransferase involved in cell wall biosynthesis